MRCQNGSEELGDERTAHACRAIATDKFHALRDPGWCDLPIENERCVFISYKDRHGGRGLDVRDDVAVHVPHLFAEQCQ